VGQSLILERELIDESVSLGGTLLDVHLTHQAALVLRVSEPAVPANTLEDLLLSLDLEIEIVVADGAKADG
jgi:hypothetical protein